MMLLGLQDRDDGTEMPRKENIAKDKMQSGRGPQVS